MAAADTAKCTWRPERGFAALSSTGLIHADSSDTDSNSEVRPKTAAVDVHCHHVSRALADVDRGFVARSDDTWGEALFFHDRYVGPLTPRLTDIDLTILDMESARLSHRLCCTASWLTCYWAEPSLGRTITRATNETMARDVAKHPTRLLGLASLPLQDVEGAIAELTYATATLGMVGVALGTNVNGVYFDHPQFEPLFAAIQELNVPIFFHPDEVLGEERLKDYWLIRLIGNPHEAASALAHLIFGGVLERYPDLKVCFPMGGGSFAHLLGRITRDWSVTPGAQSRTSLPPREYLERCYFDTVVHSPSSFEFLLKFVSPSHLVLGSDYPWDMGLAEPRRLIEESSLSAEEGRGVLAGNIGDLLGRKFGSGEQQEMMVRSANA